MDPLSAFDRALTFVDTSISTALESCRQRIRAHFKASLAHLVPPLIIPALKNFAYEKNIRWQRSADDTLAAIAQESVAKRINLPVGENSTLEGISISKKRRPVRNQKVIVYFPDSNQIWQQVVSMLLSIHTKTGYDIVSYNYRGVAGSTGFPGSEDELLNDSVKIVHALTTAGISPKRTVLYGKSFGAAIATCTAGILADEGHVVHLVAIDGFRNLQRLVQATIRIFSHTIQELFASYGWQLDAERAIPKLEGKLVLAQNKDNPQIPIEAAFKAAFDSAEYRPECIEIALDEAEFQREKPDFVMEADIKAHCRPFSTREESELIRALQQLTR